MVGHDAGRALPTPLPGGSVLDSSASFQWIENETKCLPPPLLARFSFSVISTANKHLPRPLGFFSIISMD